MRKTAVSVTLDPGNLAWLRARAAATGARSLSAALDGLLADVRAGTPRRGRPGSVRGTIRIAPEDPDLARADEALAGLFPSPGRFGRADA